MNFPINRRRCYSSESKSQMTHARSNCDYIAAKRIDLMITVNLNNMIIRQIFEEKKYIKKHVDPPPIPFIHLIFTLFPICIYSSSLYYSPISTIEFIARHSSKILWSVLLALYGIGWLVGTPHQFIFNSLLSIHYAGNKIINLFNLSE